jgi:membrane-associated phospholipid phosphatase
MTYVAAFGRRYLPHGWGDLFRQLVIWLGFGFAYQLARGLADRNPAKAFENGLRVIDVERGAHALFEVSLQHLMDSPGLLTTFANWTYWGSQFTVVGLALLWVYLRHNEAFVRFRNVLLLANAIGLVGYVLMPTAPPRMFPGFGFMDTLAAYGSIQHESGLVQLAANPYAAMPSLHSADALIVGVVLASVVRPWPLKIVWLLWPAWVWFCVMATGNHYWLDVVGGIVVAGVAAAVVYRPGPLRRLRVPIGARAA